MVTIRRAHWEDVPRIMDFYKRNWSEHHIMANNRTLFEYMHCDGDKVQYIFAQDEQGQICGALGYISMNECEHPDICSMMIRCLPCEIDILSDELHKALYEETKHRLLLGVGINMRTIRYLAELTDVPIVRMKHFYRLGQKEQYHIATILDATIKPYQKNKIFTYREIDDFASFDTAFTEEDLQGCIPYKSKKYIRHRFFEHPYYKYLHWYLQRGSEKGYLTARCIEQSGCRILRFMNYLGSDLILSDIGEMVDELIRQYDLEYVDFYCYGIDSEILEKAGFSERIEQDVNIIPNYFEPFERKNVEIYCTILGNSDGVHIYKSDGDQDRPNII